MPEYKLTYFNIRARAEVTRMLFTMAGVEFEDKRFDFGSPDWPAFKPSVFKYLIGYPRQFFNFSALC